MIFSYYQSCAENSVLCRARHFSCQFSALKLKENKRWLRFWKAEVAGEQNVRRVGWNCLKLLTAGCCGFLQGAELQRSPCTEQHGGAAGLRLESAPLWGGGRRGAVASGQAVALADGTTRLQLRANGWAQVSTSGSVALSPRLGCIAVWEVGSVLGGRAAVCAANSCLCARTVTGRERSVPLERGAPLPSSAAGDAAAQERPAPTVGDSQTPQQLFFCVFPKIIPVLFTSIQGPNRRAQVSEGFHPHGPPPQAGPGAPRGRILRARATAMAILMFLPYEERASDPPRAVPRLPAPLARRPRAAPGRDPPRRGGGARRRSGRSALPRWRRARPLSPPKMAGRGGARSHGAPRGARRARRLRPPHSAAPALQRSARAGGRAPAGRWRRRRIPGVGGGLLAARASAFAPRAPHRSPFPPQTPTPSRRRSRWRSAWCRRGWPATAGPARTRRTT